MKLSQIKKDQLVEISHIEDKNERGMLFNMGIFQGTTVSLVQEPYFGRPMVIRHGENQLVGLRKEVAERIEVKVVDK